MKEEIVNKVRAIGDKSFKDILKEGKLLNGVHGVIAEAKMELLERILKGTEKEVGDPKKLGGLPYWVYENAEGSLVLSLISSMIGSMIMNTPGMREEPKTKKDKTEREKLLKETERELLRAVNKPLDMYRKGTLADAVLGTFKAKESSPMEKKIESDVAEAEKEIAALKKKGKKK